jgi:hypothetical protein
MSNELELELLEKIAQLEKEILKLSGKTEKDEIPSFSFSNISENELNSIVEIEQKFIEHQFNSWFNSKIEISDEVENFLKILLLKVKNLIQSFHEEDDDTINLYNMLMIEDGEPVYLSDGVWLYPNGRMIDLKTHN